MSTWIITGYKPHELGIYKQTDPAVFYIKKALEQQIRLLIEEGLEWLVISGQLGVECWAAEVLCQLKGEYSEVRLAILTPFLDQQQNWNEENQLYYESILAQADFVASVSKEPYKSAQQFRNKNVFLLQKSDGLLIFFDEEKEGSPQFLFHLAKQWQEHHSYDIRQITFFDLQFIVEEEQSKVYEQELDHFH